MYCTYCRKDVSSPHRCDETVNRVASIPYIHLDKEVTWHDKKGRGRSSSHGYMAGRCKIQD